MPRVSFVPLSGLIYGCIYTYIHVVCWRGAGSGVRWRGAGTGVRWRGAGSGVRTGGHLRGAGTGGHLRGAGTGGDLRGAGTGGDLRGAASWGRSWELDGTSRGSGELGGTSRGSGELDGTSRGSGELDGTSRGSGELGGTSRGSWELDGTSRGSWELDGTSRGSGELDGTSRGSGGTGPGEAGSGGTGPGEAGTGGRCRGAGTGENLWWLRHIGLAIFFAGRQGGAAVRVGGLGGAADDGRLVLARALTLSRHRRIPSLQHSPLVSGRSTGRWELALCQNRERMVASSNAVAAASPQNSREYSGKGRSRWARAMKRAATSIAAGARKNRKIKKLFKNGKKKRGRRDAASPCFRVRYSVTLSEGRARSEETLRISNIDFNKTRKTFNTGHQTRGKPRLKNTGE